MKTHCSQIPVSVLSTGAVISFLHSKGYRNLFLISDSESETETYLQDCIRQISQMSEQLTNLQTINIQKISRLDTALIRKVTTQKDALLHDLNRPLPSVGCVVMASGLGTRFGSNKLMADLNGVPVISHLLNTLLTVPFSSIVTVTRYPDIVDLCSSMNIDAVLHQLPDRSDTVRLGLSRLTALADPHIPSLNGCLFCQADQPFVSRSSLEQMLLAALYDSSCIYRLADGEIIGSPILFPASFFPELMALKNSLGGGAVCRQHPNVVRTVQITNELRTASSLSVELQDIDTVEQLSELRKINRLSKIKPLPH